MLSGLPKWVLENYCDTVSWRICSGATRATLAHRHYQRRTDARSDAENCLCSAAKAGPVLLMVRRENSRDSAKSRISYHSILSQPPFSYLSMSTSPHGSVEAPSDDEDSSGNAQHKERKGRKKAAAPSPSATRTMRACLSSLL